MSGIFVVQEAPREPVRRPSNPGCLFQSSSGPGGLGICSRSVASPQLPGIECRLGDRTGAFLPSFSKPRGLFPAEAVALRNGFCEDLSHLPPRSLWCPLRSQHLPCRSCSPPCCGGLAGIPPASEHPVTRKAGSSGPRSQREYAPDLTTGARMLTRCPRRFSLDPMIPPSAPMS